MKKRTFCLAMAAVMAFGLTGCGGAQTKGEAATTAESTADTTAADTTAADKAADTSAAESETSAEAQAAGGHFIVGFDQEFPPMGFMGDNGEYTGFDLELAQEVAKRLGLEYQPQPIIWDTKDMELDSGNIDCIWNGFTMTGRESDYEWTEAYMANSQVFVVAADSGIASMDDLKGKVVELSLIHI